MEGSDLLGSRPAGRGRDLVRGAAYAYWLCETLGGHWRLPTEAEWEHGPAAGWTRAHALGTRGSRSARSPSRRSPAPGASGGARPTTGPARHRHRGPRVVLRLVRRAAPTARCAVTTRAGRRRATTRVAAAAPGASTFERSRRRARGARAAARARGRLRLPRRARGPVTAARRRDRSGRERRPRPAPRARRAHEPVLVVGSRLVNIGPGGLMLEAPVPLAPDSPLQLHLLLGGERPTSTRACEAARARQRASAGLGRRRAVRDPRRPPRASGSSARSIGPRRRGRPRRRAAASGPATPGRRREPAPASASRSPSSQASRTRDGACCRDVRGGRRPEPGARAGVAGQAQDRPGQRRALRPPRPPARRRPAAARPGARGRTRRSRGPARARAGAPPRSRARWGSAGGPRRPPPRCGRRVRRAARGRSRP